MLLKCINRHKGREGPPPQRGGQTKSRLQGHQDPPFPLPENPKDPGPTRGVGQGATNDQTLPAGCDYPSRPQTLVVPVKSPLSPLFSSVPAACAVKGVRDRKYAHLRDPSSVRQLLYRFCGSAEKRRRHDGRGFTWVSVWGSTVATRAQGNVSRPKRGGNPCHGRLPSHQRCLRLPKGQEDPGPCQRHVLRKPPAASTGDHSSATAPETAFGITKQRAFVNSLAFTGFQATERVHDGEAARRQEDCPGRLQRGEQAAAEGCF